MIETLRAFASSWVAKLLLAVLVVSFLFFGIDQFGRSSASRVAAVGEREITIRDFADSFNEQMRLGGFRGTPQEAVSFGYHLAVLGQMAASAAVLDEADEIGLAASDADVVRAIADIPRFQSAVGGFDRAAYERELEFERIRASEFEERVRDDLTQQLMLAAVSGGPGADRADAERIWRRSVERRDVAYVVLTATPEESAQTPPPGALEAFYDANPELFTTPEYREVGVFLATADQRIGSFEADVTEEAIRRVYDARQATYRRPEQRAFDRLIFDDQAAAESAKARLDAAADAAARDAAVAELAAELGAARESLVVPLTTEAEFSAFGAEAATEAFAAGGPAVSDDAGGAAGPVGAVAGPVEAPLGWAIFVVTEAFPEQITSLEEASEDIRREIAANDARRGMPQLQTSVEDQRAAGATLEAIAEQENAIYERVVIDRAGLDPERRPVTILHDRQALIALAFPPNAASADAVIDRENEMVRGPDGAFFTATVTDVRPATLQPLADVRDQVAEAWAAEQAETALGARAQALIERLDAGEAFSEIAAAEELELQEAPGLRRGAPIEGVPATALEALFAPGAEPGATATARLDPAASLEIGDDGATVGTTPRPRLALARLSAIQEATSERAAEEIDAIRTQLDIWMAEDLRLAFMNGARAERDARGDVTVDEAGLLTALGLGPAQHHGY